MDNESSIGGNQPEEKSEAKTWNKKSRNRGMNAYAKLVLIWEYCEYKKDYKTRVKTVFWTMIWELLKKRTRYNLVKPRNMVIS